MIGKNKIPVLVYLLLILVLIHIPEFPAPKGKIIFHSINGFSAKVNKKIESFLHDVSVYRGRKIAVFDGDGTVLGQVPHYLADECLYSFANEHPQRKTDLIQKMKNQSNVSMEYVQNRVHFMSGDSLSYWRELGFRHFKKYYLNKIFSPMKKLITLLQQNNFEVWVISASPEAMYQKFLSEALVVPITHIIGVKSVINNGIITDEIIMPVPQDHGKKEAIESFVQDRPLFAAGNSRGDKEMIEYASKLRMIINPDEFVAPDQNESIAQYARRNSWLIANISDTTNTNFPSVSSKVFGVKTNKSNKVKMTYQQN
jgi:phosphoserine phosphatase